MYVYIPPDHERERLHLIFRHITTIIPGGAMTIYRALLRAQSLHDAALTPHSGLIQDVFTRLQPSLLRESTTYTLFKECSRNYYLRLGWAVYDRSGPAPARVYLRLTVTSFSAFCLRQDPPTCTLFGQFVFRSTLKNSNFVAFLDNYEIISSGSLIDPRSYANASCLFMSCCL